VAAGILPAYRFSVLPASCRQNETLRDRKLRRRDAGSTLDEFPECRAADLIFTHRTRADDRIEAISTAREFRF
jgi:hypothetical protein